MAQLIEVEINGLLTPVDAEEWGVDPDAVIAEVMANRETMKLGGPDTSKAAAKIRKGEITGE